MSIGGNLMSKRKYLAEGRKGRWQRKGADMLEAFLGRVFIWMTNQPWAQKHPWFNPAKSDTRWLPINTDIEMPDNCPMPVAMLDQLIEEASHRVIIDFCGCRNAFLCEDYPIDIGCLFLGDDALDLKVYPRREVTVEEAKRHVRRAVDAGLIPGVGKARVDTWLFKVPDRGRLLSICFCCDCCCLGRYVHCGPVDVVEGITSRLPGHQPGDNRRLHRLRHLRRAMLHQRHRGGRRQVHLHPQLPRLRTLRTGLPGGRHQGAYRRPRIRGQDPREDPRLRQVRLTDGSGFTPRPSPSSARSLPRAGPVAAPCPPWSWVVRSGTPPSWGPCRGPGARGRRR